MEQLIKDLKDLNMIYDDLHFSFMKGKPPIASGLIGALIENKKTYFCSWSKEYLYFFKIKYGFSYKGIKLDTISKIKISDIEKVEWRPKMFSGFFKIYYNDEKLTGTLSRGGENREKFETFLSFLEAYSNIIFKVY